MKSQIYYWSPLLFFFIIFFLMVTPRMIAGDDLFYFDPSPVGQDVIEGDPVTLRCDVSNRHLVVFYWTLDNKVLTNSTRRHQIDSDLRITRVDRALDSGSFRCVATNVSTGAAVRSSVAVLNILWISEDVTVQESPPSSPSSSSSSPGDGPQIMKCISEGNPEPAVEWFRNGVRLQSSERIKVTRHGLRISGMTSLDWGVYSCLASNEAGSVESLHNFVLTGRAPRLLSPLTFSRPVHMNEVDDVQLDCHFQEPVVHVDWFFNDSKIMRDSLRHTLFGNGTLVIKRATRVDEGLYRCQASYSKSDQFNFATKVLVSYLNEMSENSLDPSPSSAHVVPIATRSEAKCYPPKGLPKPSLRWKNPQGRDVGGEGRIRSRGGVLTIVNAEEGDSGVYQCVVENTAAQAAIGLEIVVTVPPKVQRLSTVETVQEGEVAVFECRYSGTSPPFTDITWKKNGAFIETSRDSRMEAYGTKLKILNVLSSDEGSYGCVISTRGHVPVHVHVAQLYVASRLKFLPMPSVVQLEMGSVGQVPCFAEGKTPPIVFWKRIGSLLSSATRNLPRPSKASSSQSLLSILPDHVTSENGVLRFNSVKREDAGLYVCFAVSTQGSINFTVKVEVIVKPHLTLKPGNITITEMSHLVIDCEVSGEPLPSVEWIKNMKSRFIDDFRIKVAENNSLIFSEVHYEDIGWYSCNAFSVMGFAKQDFYVDVVDSVHHVSNVEGSFWNAQKMSLVTAGCSVAYLGLMVVLITCCLIRRRKMKKMMIAEEIRHVQKDILSAFSSSSSKSEKLSSVAAQESSRLMTPIPVSVDSDHRWTRDCSMSSFLESNSAVNFKRDRLQIISRLGRGSYGDIMLARLSPSNMSMPHFNSSRVVVVKMLQDDDNHGSSHDNYDQLENIYDDVYSVGNKIRNDGDESTGRSTGAVRSDRGLLAKESLPGHSSHNSNLHRGRIHRKDSRNNSVDGSSRSEIYENFRDVRSGDVGKDEFARDLELLQLGENQRCISGLVGASVSMRPHILVFECSEKGNLRDFLQSFLPDQLPNMPFILTLDRQLHFCHQVALGMLKLNEVVNDKMSMFGSSGSTHLLMPLKHLAARNVFVTPCLDAKISLDGPCFRQNDSNELDEDYVWHNNRPLLLRWSAPEMLSQRSQRSNAHLCNLSLPSSNLSNSFKSTSQHWPSDVWSYGMTAIEIFTFAARPFPELINSQVLSKLLQLAEISHSNTSTISNGDRRTARNAVHGSFTKRDDTSSGGSTTHFLGAVGVKSPLGCPEPMWQIVRQCLNPLPRERPTFESVVREIESIIQCMNRSS